MNGGSTQDPNPNPKSRQREGNPDFEILEERDLDDTPRTFDHDDVGYGTEHRQISRQGGSGRWFRLSVEQYDAINYIGMAPFKLGIILFNLVPYVPLRNGG
jgi:hypothetical protein